MNHHHDLWGRSPGPSGATALRPSHLRAGGSETWGIAANSPGDQERGRRRRVHLRIQAVKRCWILGAAMWMARAMWMDCLLLSLVSLNVDIHPWLAFRFNAVNWYSRDTVRIIRIESWCISERLARSVHLSQQRWDSQHSRSGWSPLSTNCTDSHNFTAQPLGLGWSEFMVEYLVPKTVPSMSMLSSIMMMLLT